MHNIYQSVVLDTVRDLAATEETITMTGYCADFSLFKIIGADGKYLYKTGLVEVNDGYVAGRYDEILPKDFTDMIVSIFGSQQNRNAPRK